MFCAHISLRPEGLTLKASSEVLVPKQAVAVLFYGTSVCAKHHKPHIFRATQSAL